MRLGTEQIYYVLDNGQQYGPCSESEIAQCVAGGTFTAAAQVCRSGAPVWSPLPAQIAALAPARAAAWEAPAVRATLGGPRKKHVGSGASVAAIVCGIIAVGLILAFVFHWSKPAYTLDQYSRIKNGMSYAEVVAILGPGEKTEQSADRFGDLKLESQIYLWKGRDGVEIKAGFLNDYMIAKTAKGL